MKTEVASVFYPALGTVVEHWKLVIFSDAAHANLDDKVSSVGAHIIYLVNKTGFCCPLTWQSSKIKRVVRSTIAAEALSLQEGLEDAIYLRQILLDLLSVVIPIEAYVDNKSVVEAIHSTKLVDDKRLRLDMGAIKESLQRGEVQRVSWCPGAAQLANCMTKRGAAGFQLQRVIQSGRLTVEGWSFQEA